MKQLLKLILLLLLLICTNARAQQNELDSLKLALKNAANDTVRMLTLYNLSNYYIENNADSALFFGNQAMSTAKKLKQPLWIAILLLRPNAYITGQKGNLTAAIKYVNEARTIIEDKKNEEDAYIPKEDEFAGNPHKYRISLLVGIFQRLGSIYSGTGDNEKAISYYRQEIALADSLKTNKGKVTSNMNISAIYIRLNQFDSALVHAETSLKYANLTGSTKYNGYTLQQIGTAYLKKGMTDSARYYYSKALQESKKYNITTIEVRNNIAFAELYEGLHQADSLKYYAGAALQLAVNLKDTGRISTAAEMLSTANKMQGNADSALKYLTLSKTMGDSVNAARNKNVMQFQSINFEEQMRLEKAAQESAAYTNKIRTTALIGGLVLLSLLAFVFYRSNKQKQKDNIALQQQKQTIENTLHELKATQQQLIQSEKMASLGELTAGIAHEIQNPLNFVNNFSEVNQEMLEELKAERLKPNAERDDDLQNDLIDDVIANEEKINHHGKRADSIVKGMMQHSRQSSGKKEPTDINALCDEYLRLSYHGLRAKEKSFNADFKTGFDESIGKINAVPQDIGRVLLNIINNAFYAVNERYEAEGVRQKPESNSYVPAVTIVTKKVNDKVEIIVKDNGNGIPQNIVDKIFQPFFTTKPTGSGTGLGLSLSYDIIKAHGGEIKVETKEGEGTKFIIQLPVA